MEKQKFGKSFYRFAIVCAVFAAICNCEIRAQSIPLYYSYRAGKSSGLNSPQQDQTAPNKAASQLVDYAASHSQSDAGIVKTEEGCPVPSLTASLAVGQRGHVLLEDVILINDLASFARERIPERVVHAQGFGAFGSFRLTKDISTLTNADFLNGVGKTTRVTVRISPTAGATGTPDLERGGRGFAIKFYTIDGVFDLVGNSAGMFSINDPMIFGDLNRSRKPNPETNVLDATMRWDFASFRHETVLFDLRTFSDFGANGRVLNCFSVHAFQFRNKEGAISFVKFHLLSQQPFKWFNSTELKVMAGRNPDYGTQDLFNAIANENFPKWTVKIQVMTVEQAAKYHVHPFDVTKIWREEDFPLMTIGELVLNENPQNHFVDIEQSAYDPANLVPGIEANPHDKMFTSRMFSYKDSQRYRLGINFAQLAVNRPPFPVKNYLRDGMARRVPNGGASPNYFPNSFHGPTVNSSVLEMPFPVKGIVDRVDTHFASIEETFALARDYLYKTISAEHRGRVAQNLGNSLAKAIQRVRDKVIREVFFRISNDFGLQVLTATQKVLASQ